MILILLQMAIQKVPLCTLLQGHDLDSIPHGLVIYTVHAVVGQWNNASAQKLRHEDAWANYLQVCEIISW